MATRRKTNKKLDIKGWISLGIFSAMLLALVIIMIIGFINASLLRVRRAEVVLPDLPQSFDGTTLLYASDIDICGVNTPARAGTLFNQLQSLKPDLLILGGDYNSISLFDRLNRPEKSVEDDSNAMASRSDFFHYISAFQAPLGKYAIASTDDVQLQNLQQVMKQNNIQPLINNEIKIQSGNDTLRLIGFSGRIANLNDTGRAFSRNDCVIAIADSPDILPVLMTSEASDNGQWADLILCGHTHGGQIRLFGRTVLSLSDTEKRFLSGWNTQSGIPILTTEGIGCEGLNMRLGTEPEIWLITLRTK